MERYFCLDCLMTGPLARNGDCATCQSKAVVSVEASRMLYGPTVTGVGQTSRGVNPAWE